MRRPQLGAADEAVVLAMMAVVDVVRAVVTVGDVEAKAVLAPPLLHHQPRLFVVARQSVLFLQVAQRERSVDRLEDDGTNNLEWGERFVVLFFPSKPAVGINYDFNLSLLHGLLSINHIL